MEMKMLWPALLSQMQPSVIAARKALQVIKVIIAPVAVLVVKHMPVWNRAVSSFPDESVFPDELAILKPNSHVAILQTCSSSHRFMVAGTTPLRMGRDQLNSTVRAIPTSPFRASAGRSVHLAAVLSGIFGAIRKSSLAVVDVPGVGSLAYLLRVFTVHGYILPQGKAYVYGDEDVMAAIS